MLSDNPSIYEFIERFPDEKAAFEYIEGRRWPDGVACPRCGSKNIHQQPDYRYHECRDCERVFTVRTGTVFERSHVPLHKWLLTMYLMYISRKGISSVQLAKTLGVTQKTAWFMLHRLREACDLPIGQLSGVVEVDETYVGGMARSGSDKARKAEGRGIVGKQPVLGFRERNGRVVLYPIEDTTGPTIEGEIHSRVSPDTTVYTDQAGSYQRLDRRYEHDFVNHSKKEWARGDVHTNSIESIWAVLKRAYRGIYHQWEHKHTERYTREISFRLNTHNLLSALNNFIDGAIGKRLTYQQLIA